MKEYQASLDASETALTQCLPMDRSVGTILNALLKMCIRDRLKGQPLHRRPGHNHAIVPRFANLREGLIKARKMAGIGMEMCIRDRIWDLGQALKGV